MATAVSLSWYVSGTVQLQFLCGWLLTGGTVIPLILIAVVPTILVTTRDFMPAGLTVIP